MHEMPISNTRVQIMPRILLLAFLSIFVICAVQASASAPGEVAFGGTGTSPATLNLTFSDGTQLALQAVSQGWWSGKHYTGGCHERNIGGPSGYFVDRITRTYI